MTAVPSARQCLDDLAFGARDALQAAEALQMLGAGVGDEADARRGDLDQRGDVAAPDWRPSQ